MDVYSNMTDDYLSVMNSLVDNLETSNNQPKPTVSALPVSTKYKEPKNQEPKTIKKETQFEDSKFEETKYE